MQYFPPAGSGSSGGPTGTDYADSCARADQPDFAGDEWLCVETRTAEYSAAVLQQMIGTDGVKLFVGTASGSGITRVALIPAKLNSYALWTRAQYAQYKFLTDNSIPGNLTRMGPSVFCNPNVGRGYVLEIQWDVTKAILTRYAAGFSQQPTIGVAFTIALNDVLRIEAFPDDGGPGVHRVKTYRNGVLKDNLTDNAGVIPATGKGLPCIAFGFASSGRNQALSDFACGAL